MFVSRCLILFTESYMYVMLDGTYKVLRRAVSPDFSNHASHFGRWASPEDEAVTPVFVIWLSGIFEICEDLVDRDAGEVGGQQF